VQVLRGDRRRDVRARALDEPDRLLGGGVLEHDLELGQLAQQRDENAFDEHRLAVEHVDRRSVTSPWTHSTMPIAGHPLEHAADFARCRSRRWPSWWSRPAG
jgi:hypothetical protein